MSEIKVNSVVNSTGDNDSGLDLSTNDNIKFKIANSQKAIIDASGNVGIGTSSPSHELHITGSSDTRAIITSGGSGDAVMMFENASGNTWGHGLDLSSGNYVIGYNASGDPSLTSDGKVNIDTSGNVLVGTTDNNPNNNNADSTADNGIALLPSGLISIATHSNATMVLNRTGSDGNLMDLRRSGLTKGKIDVGSSSMAIFATGVNNGGWSFGDGAGILPMKNQGLADNNMDLGASSNRMDDIFATNGTIQTSDENEKQDIASATAKELNVAKKLSALFKTFRWRDKVAEKGDKARTHTGIVAQEVLSAFKAEGLDASKYGLFTSDTWWEKEIKVDAVKADEEKGIEAKDAHTYMDTKKEKTDGYTERTRLGVRYPELFSFIFSSIEARLTALESK
jgi:hypothetical protein